MYTYYVLLFKVNSKKVYCVCLASTENIKKSLTFLMEILNYDLFSRLFWIKHLLPLENITRKKNWFYFVARLRLNFPKKSRKKIKQVWNMFHTSCFIASIKNIKQNIRENIVQCWFYDPSIKILRACYLTPIPTFC